MVFVVERYIPGLETVLLQDSLQRLHAVTEQLSREGSEILYLGSTIVARDEACFCHFEAQSEAVVIEANRRAGLRVDRIVPAELRSSRETHAAPSACRRSATAPQLSEREHI